MKSICNHSYHVTALVVWLAYFHNGEAVNPGGDGCDIGAVRLGQQCYRFETDRKSWKQANSYCRSKGMTLALVDSNRKHKAITDHMLKLAKETAHGVSFWIDIRRIQGKYVHMSSGKEARATFWFPGQPDNFKNRENCVASEQKTQWKSYGWNDIQCDALLGTLCETKAVKASVSPCQDGVVKLGRPCYILETVPKTWKSARASCQRKSMDLLRVDTVEEHMAVTKYLKGKKEHHYIWTDVKKMFGTFRHTAGSPKLSVTFWNPSEPSNSWGMENCVEYRRLGWNDEFCDKKNRYICEMKGCLPNCTKKETSKQDKTKIKSVSTEATTPYTTVGYPHYITTTNKAAPSTTQEVYKNTLPMTDNSSVEHGGDGMGGVDEEKVMKMMMMTSTDTNVDIHQKMSEHLDHSQSECKLTKPRAVTVTALVVIAVVWRHVYK